MKLYSGDCFDHFKEIDNNSIDLVLTDPPYGTTSIKWDSILDFDLLWSELDRIVKPTTPIILFGSQPFSSLLVSSNTKWFRHELIWNKNKCGSPGLAKQRPQKVHENILIFSKETPITYNPIMEEGNPYTRFNADGYGSGKNSHEYGFGNNEYTSSLNEGTRYPKSILHASRNFSAQQTLHPTQKPTNLLNWLIMTYSNPGDLVLDFTMGSGSTGVACKMTNRHFIGIEKETEYFEIAKKRIELCNVIVKDSDRQLTTQLSKEMITVPKNKHEENFYKFLTMDQENEFFKRD